MTRKKILKNFRPVFRPDSSHQVIGKNKKKDEMDMPRHTHVAPTWQTLHSHMAPKWHPPPALYTNALKISNPIPHGFYIYAPTSRPSVDY